MAQEKGVTLPCLIESLSRILTKNFEHSIAGDRLPCWECGEIRLEQRLIDEVAEGFEDLPTMETIADSHGFNRLQGAAAGKD